MPESWVWIRRLRGAPKGIPHGANALTPEQRTRSQQTRREQEEPARAAIETQRANDERASIAAEVEAQPPQRPPNRYAELTWHQRTVPDSRRGIVSPREAELFVAEWMRILGARDAAVTQYVADGGVDIVSRGFVAQVKHYRGSVGVAAVRELRGAAAVMDKRPLFFTSGSYTRAATAFADEAEIPLICYSTEPSAIAGANALGHALVSCGRLPG